MSARAERFSEAARRYSELGWALIPVDGKKPRGAAWQTTQPDRDLEHAAGVWSVWGDRWNMGAVLGPSGVAVVEFDSTASGDKLLELIDGELPTTPIVQARRGLHLYFNTPAQADKVARDGLELRAGGHMCVLPPSEHPETGGAYRWMHGLEPWSVPLADIPQTIVDYFKTTSNGNRASTLGETIPEGGRNETLASYAGTMRRRGASTAAILAALRVENAERCLPPLPDEELERIAASIARYPATHTPVAFEARSSVLEHTEVAASTNTEPAEPVDLAELLDDVVAFVTRFVVMSAEQALAVVLWVLHTWTFEAAETTPYLIVSSAEKRSGKTRLLEVLELLVREPLPTANISDAALFRAISELSPSLLMDEVDSVFGPKARDREDLRGMLNAGYRQGAVVRRMGGPRMTTLEAFPVYCAKAFAGIGNALPDTIVDRSIPIRLERRTRDERVERFRRRDVAPGAAALRGRLADSCPPRLDELHAARPALPDELDDRAQDFWEPLLAIADLAGGDWPGKARAAAVVLSGPEARATDDDSQTARLLADIHHVFDETGETRFRTADLIGELCKIEESPWGDWYGKPITSHALSRLLKPHRIKTMTVKVEGTTVRGYRVEQFTDAFLRVLGVTSVTGVTSRVAPDAAGNAGNACNAQGTEAAAT